MILMRLQAKSVARKEAKGLQYRKKQRYGEKRELMFFSANCSTTIPSAKHLNIDIGGLYPKLSEALKDSD